MFNNYFREATAIKEIPSPSHFTWDYRPIMKCNRILYNIFVYDYWLQKRKIDILFLYETYGDISICTVCVLIFINIDIDIDNYIITILIQ